MMVSNFDHVGICCVGVDVVYGYKCHLHLWQGGLGYEYIGQRLQYFLLLARRPPCADSRFALSYLPIFKLLCP
jgi:hypothetical protein